MQKKTKTSKNLLEFCVHSKDVKLVLICCLLALIWGSNLTWFLQILAWSPACLKNTCRAKTAPCCSSYSSHHHHLVVVFWPPWWSHNPQLGSSQLPSYQRLDIDHWFDLGITGSHLEPHHKSVPLFSFQAKIHVLICGLLAYYVGLFGSFLLKHVTLTYLDQT